MVKRSEYYGRLEGPVKKRYDDKIKHIGNLDPYAITTDFHNDEWSKFPNITLLAMYDYLIGGMSFYTREIFEAHKSLGAANYVASGKVGNLRVRKIGDKYLLRARVKHSYTEGKSLDVWVICDSRDVLSSHCDCPAGLREGCSHVGAVLFCVMFGRAQQQSVTDVGAYWAVPSGAEQAEQKKLKDINFATPEKIMRRKLGLECEPLPKKQFRPEASADEFNELIKGMWGTGHVGAVHLVVEPYAEANKKNLPHTLSELYKKENENLSLEDLCRLGESTPIGWTKEERQLIGKLTIGQSVKRIWFMARAGLVRGSLMKRCCRTDPLAPSVSLLRQVCYPHLSRFKTAATVYGCDHEDIALKAYVRKAQSLHVNFQQYKSGFSICEEVQFIGSSTDGFVSCSCHGKGCIEIKCPFCLKDASAEEILNAKTCLETVPGNAPGRLITRLKRDSDYYYQVQTELFSTGTTYCDFVLWTSKTVFIERIHPDHELWSEIKDKASKFFKMAVMPEMLAKYFTRKAAAIEESRVQGIITPGEVPKGVKKLPKKKRKSKRTTNVVVPQAQAVQCHTPSTPSNTAATTRTVLGQLQPQAQAVQCRTPSTPSNTAATTRTVLGQLQPQAQAVQCRTPSTPSNTATTTRIVLGQLQPQAQAVQCPTPSTPSNTAAAHAHLTTPVRAVPHPAVRVVVSPPGPSSSSTPVRVVEGRRKQQFFLARLLRDD